MYMNITSVSFKDTFGVPFSTQYVSSMYVAGLLMYRIL